MKMTREESIKCMKTMQQWIPEWDDREDGLSYWDAIDMALSALRPVSRERVEKMRGEWMFKPFYKGTSRGAIECQECKGAFEGSVEFNFCPNCGAPMTDEAMKMVMKRLDALRDE